jgi:hypothetical protein
MDKPADPGYRTAYNINYKLKASNKVDENENPSGGEVSLHVTKKGDSEFPALIVNWQDGPRNNVEPANGAFVEDVLWAALQRLEFFQDSKYRCRENAIAITKIEEALFILKDRQLSRSYRGVEGKHEV